MDPNVEVEMLAFGKPDEIRVVEIENPKPNDDLLTTLGKVFYWGQNDFQARRHPSVSVGDVIRLKDEKYLVCGCGFRKLTKEEYEQHKAMDRRDRSFNPICHEENVE